MSSDNQKIAVREQGQQITEEEIGQYLHRRRWNQQAAVGSDWVYNLLSAAARDSAWDTQVMRLEQEACVRDDACHSCHHFMSRMKEVGPTVAAVWYKESCTTASCSAGSNAGCALCKLIQDSLTPLGTFDLVQRIEQCLSRPVLRITGMWSSEGRILIEVAIHCRGADPVMLSLRACETQAVHGLDAAKSWLEACKSQHDCASRYTDLALPTRLIDLAQLRIIETASLHERPQYATLSYCWGRGSKVKLTKQTYEAFQSSIPEDDLPATIRDAIHVAKQLDVQWLWVDALCIIQDQSEPVDWRAEAAIMGDIFGGGCINLAASTSADVYDGALQTSLAGFETSLLGGRKHVFLAHAWKMAVTDSVLARRGWAFQERLLAPRTLYLSQHGLFWECSNATHAEYVTAYPDQHIVDKLCLGRRQAWDWCRLVESYSRTKLSMGGDRLIAMAGLAKCQQRLNASSYHAGLWRQSMEMQLAWACYTDISTRRHSWAPSWSWAGLESPVFYEDWNMSKIDLMVEVLSVQTQVVTDAFGEVNGGCLGLACQGVVPAHVSGSDIEFGEPVFRTSFLPDVDGQVAEAYIVPLFVVTVREHRKQMISLVLAHSSGMLHRIGRHDTGIMDFDDPRALPEVLKRAGESALAAMGAERLEDGRYVLEIV